MNKLEDKVALVTVSRVRRQQLHNGNGIVCGWRNGTSVGLLSRRKKRTKSAK
jgi:hypothetical protein